MKTSKQMTEEVYKILICRRCRKPLTKKQMDKARKLNFLPLCPPCDIMIREALKKCIPLMQKLRL